MKLISTSYARYAESHNEWLDKLPSDWEEKRVKDLFRLVTDMAVNNNNFELLSLYAAIGVRPRKDLEARGNKASSTDGYWLVKKGDIVVNKLLAWMGSVGLSEFDGVTSPAYDILRKTNKAVDPRYFSYLFRTDRAKEIFKRNSRGIMDMRLRLYFDKLGALVVPVPPFVIQQSIANYLDEKTTNIDQQIDLLTQKAKHYGELRQALINETVTRGLDKSVPMKDSGVEWIGEIPAHWEVKRIKDITLVKRGASPRPIDDPIYFDADGEFSWVRIADLSASERYLLSTKEKLSKLGATLSVKRYPGHFILSIAGTVGKPIITKIKCCIHDGFVWFPTLKINAEYLYYIFSTGLPYRGLGKLGTQLNLNTETVGLISIPFPSDNEINKIIDYLDEKTEQIDAIVETINAQIDKLKELRKTLINDVVTGKICIL